MKKQFNQRYLVKTDEGTIAGFDAEAEANEFAAEKRQALLEEEFAGIISLHKAGVDKYSTCSHRIDEKTVALEALNLTEREREDAADVLGDFADVKNVETGTDGWTVYTVTETRETVWVEDQYESFSRLLEQANKFPDSNESTFWRVLIAEALDFGKYIPLSDVQMLQMSVADDEDIENDIPAGSVWVHLEAWTKMREVNFEFVVSRAAEKTGYRLEDHSRDGEFYTFLVVPANAE